MNICVSEEMIILITMDGFEINSVCLSWFRRSKAFRPQEISLCVCSKQQSRNTAILLISAYEGCALC